jgi:hypothetical protein
MALGENVRAPCSGLRRAILRQLRQALAEGGLYGLQNQVCGRWTPDAGCWMLHSVTSSGSVTPTSNILPCPQQCAPEIRQASLLLGFVIQEHIGASRPITSRSSPPRFVQHMVTVRTGSVGRQVFVVVPSMGSGDTSVMHRSVARQEPWVVSSPSSVRCYTVLGHPLENVNACLCN